MALSLDLTRRPKDPARRGAREQRNESRQTVRTAGCRCTNAGLCRTWHGMDLATRLVFLDTSFIDEPATGDLTRGTECTAEQAAMRLRPGEAAS